MTESYQIGVYKFKRIGEGRYHLLVVDLFRIFDFGYKSEESRQDWKDFWESKGYYVSEFFK